MKNNTNYFSHDGNAHEDMKCLELKMKHWLEWYWLYWELIERLFNEWWKLMLSKNKAIAYQLHISEQTFASIFSTLLDVWLIIKDKNNYWSDSLLNRITIKEEIKQKRIEAWRKWWTAKSKQKLANAKQIPSNKTKLNKTKLNKIKEKEIKEEDKKLYKDFVFLSETQHTQLINNYWERWNEYIRKLNDYAHQIWNIKFKNKYKSHYHTILNWLKRDWIKKSVKKFVEQEKVVEMTEEQKQANIKRLKEMKKNFFTK